MSRWSFLRTNADEMHPSTDAGPSVPGQGALGGATLTPPSGTRAFTPPSGSPRLTPSNGVDWRVRSVVQEHERITDLKLWGFRTAGAAEASPEVLKTVIGWIYHNKLTIDDAHAASEQERLAELAQDIASREAELAKANHHRAELEGMIENERQKLEAKRRELAAVQAGDGSVVEAHGLSDRASFFIAAGILALLTVYLFLFYVSAIYNGFLFDAAKAAEEGLRTGRELSVTIFNGSAFQKAWSSGFMTFAFLASAPSIVVGLGFLIHQFSKQKQRLAIAAILSVTFLFDFLLAYEIVYQIHRIRVLTGETQADFSIGVLVQTPEFYIILLAGFVVYLIWGLILRVVLEGIEKFRPARVAERTIRHAITAIEATMTRLDDELRGAHREIVRQESDLKALEHKRSPRELRNNEFRRHLEEFMQGWLTYITQAFLLDERAAKEAEAQRVRTETATLLIR